MSPNQRADLYLRAFFQGQEYSSGLSFRPQLNELNLDYSQESLARIDTLLEKIRIKKKPKYSDFYDNYANQTFIYLLCFYVGSVVSKLSDQAIRWYDYDELRKLQNNERDFPPCFANSIGCFLGDLTLFMPLSCIEEQLFVDKPSVSVFSTCLQTIERFKRDSPTIPRPTKNLLKPGANNGWTHEMGGGAQVLGFLTNWAVWQVADGETLTPIMLSEKKSIRQLAYQRLENAVAEGQKRLLENPLNEKHLALVYDGFINLSSGRIDALIAEVRCYTPKRWFKPTSQNYRFSIALPYRHANNPAGFKVFIPRLLDCDADKKDWPGIFESFYVGVDQFNQPQEVWPKHIGDTL